MIKTRSLPVTLVPILLLGSLLSSPARAMVIDDYSVADSLVNLSTSGTDESGTAINIGTFTRQLVVNGFGGTGAAIVIDDTTHTADFTTSDVGAQSVIHYVPIAGTIDLSAPGTTLDFIFDGVLSATIDYTMEIELEESVTSNVDYLPLSSFTSPATPGPISLSLASASIDTGSISRISVRFQAEPGQQATLSANVPVPGTLPLLVAALGLLGWTRARH